MNLSMLTAWVSMLIATVTGLFCGRNHGLTGCVLGVILGFATGLGMAMLVLKIERVVYSPRPRTGNSAVIMQLGILVAVAFMAPIVAALLSSGVTVLAMMLL